MNAIFAVNKIDGFGNGQDMPWPHSKEDLQRFKSITWGHTVIMGGGTWRSNMPRPLPGRRNCVLSTTITDPLCAVYPNITSLLMDIQNDENVYVIGGAKILWTLRRYINRIYLTRHLTIDRAPITLDTAKYLDGFKLIESQELDKLVFQTWEKPVTMPL